MCSSPNIFKRTKQKDKKKADRENKKKKTCEYRIVSSRKMAVKEQIGRDRCNIDEKKSNIEYCHNKTLVTTTPPPWMMILFFFGRVVIVTRSKKKQTNKEKQKTNLVIEYKRFSDIVALPSWFALFPLSRTLWKNEKHKHCEKMKKENAKNEKLKKRKRGKWKNGKMKKKIMKKWKKKQNELKIELD